MKIRTKDGSVIDLADIRMWAVSQDAAARTGGSYKVSTIGGLVMALVDALEAACGVLKHRGPKASHKLDYDDGRNDGIEQMRQAIGVIEETPVAD